MQIVQFGSSKNIKKQNSPFATFVTIPDAKNKEKMIPSDTYEKPKLPKKRTLAVAEYTLATIVAAILIKLLFFRKKRKVEATEAQMYDKIAEATKDLYSNSKEIYDKYICETGKNAISCNNIDNLFEGKSLIRKLRYQLAAERVELGDKWEPVENTILMDAPTPSIMKEKGKILASILQVRFASLEFAGHTSDSLIKQLETLIGEAQSHFNNTKERTFLCLNGIETFMKKNSTEKEKENIQRFQDFITNSSGNDHITTLIDPASWTGVIKKKPPEVRFTFHDP